VGGTGRAASPDRHPPHLRRHDLRRDCRCPRCLAGYCEGRLSHRTGLAGKPARRGVGMTPQCWRTVKTVFHEATALAPADRAEVLDRACASDPELRAEVERLLAADELADKRGFLARWSTTAPRRGPDIPDGDPPEKSPLEDRKTIGRYRVVRLLGQGGFGCV